VEVLYCNNNRLTTLEDCPSSVMILYCLGNKLVTPNYPPSVMIFAACKQGDDGQWEEKYHYEQAGKKRKLEPPQ
jgi:hypothetical protein